jgi:hypothetical protein
MKLQKRYQNLKKQKNKKNNMKITELTEEQIANAREIYWNKEMSWDERMKILMGLFGLSERTTRKWCTKLGFTEKKETIPEQYETAKLRSLDSSKSRFIITWAQNATPVHQGFYKNLEAYSKHIGADIHIILGRYQNPTSVFNDSEQEYWVKEVVKYMDASRHNVHKYLSIMSDVKIQPTATNPLSGLQSMSGFNSCVFGSPKVHMEMIPVLKGNKPKMMLTTGALTQLNYTDSKSGKKGEFHHTYGFVIVEIKDDETFYMRQVTADDDSGSFTDLCYEVVNGSVTKIDSVAVAILGDIHYGNHDQEVLDTTFDLLKALTPENVVLHDVFDGLSINHHEIKDPYVQYSKEMNGKNSLQQELDIMMAGLADFQTFKNVVIVRSNHDDFLDRWLKNEDWKKQPTTKNSKLYMKFSHMLLEQYEKDIEIEPIKGIVPQLINERYPDYITLGRDESYKVLDWELGQHGDLGTNGSRGSLNQFRTLNTKIVVGHYHTPGRKDGAIAVGTSTKLRMGYNKGASSWLHSHVLIHNDGRAQHISFIKDMNDKVGFTTFEI